MSGARPAGEGPLPVRPPGPAPLPRLPSPRASRRAGLTAAVAAALLGACAPVVTHGPRVEPGLTAGATGGTRAILCDDCSGRVIPMWGIYARYGWVPVAPGRPAAHLGVAVPSFDWEALQADAYLQAPAGAASAAGGAGVLASPRYLVPYLQAGRVAPGGSGWYTTQAVALHRYDDGVLGEPDDDFDRTEVAPLYWMPVVARRTATGDYAYHLYLAGAFGSYRKREFLSDTGETVYQGRFPLRVVMIGISVEWSRPDVALPW